MNDGRDFHEAIRVKLGTNLTRLAKSKGLTIAQLARKAGLPSSTVHGWTAGRTAVRLDQLAKVAAVLEMPLYELAFGEPDPFESPAEDILREIFCGDVRVTLHKIEKRKRK